MAYTHTHTQENGEDVEKLEASYITGRITKQCRYWGKQVGSSSKAKDELLYDLTILHLGTYLRKMKTYICTKSCTPSFIAAFFTIGKNPSVYQIMNK